MEVQWFRQDKDAVLDELRRGVRPLMAATTASGPLDELIALHIELGVFEALDRLPVRRERAGIDDALLLRTLSVLPFLAESGLDPSARLLFQEPAILLRLGWAPAQIQSGDNHRRRHPEGRRLESLPCHPDTLRDAFRRIETAAWLRVQEAGVSSLYARGLVRGKVYAIDGVLLQPEMERRPTRVILQLGRSLTMRKTRKNYTPVEKVALLRRHLIDRVPVSDLCDEHQLSPTLFYAWQKQFFENGPTAFERKNATPEGHLQRTITALRDKLQRKNEVVAELMEEHIKLKKELGEL